MVIGDKLIDMQVSGDVQERLEQISQLKSGWYYGEGDQFDKEQLQRFLQVYNSGYSSKLPNPCVYPSIDGNIQLEWTTKEVDISLTINPETLVGCYHLLTFPHQAELIQELNLCQDHDWVQLNTWITQHLI